MLKWIIVLVAVVVILGFFQSKKTKAELEDIEEEIGCGGGCAGCPNRGMCHSNENDENK